MKFPEWFYSTHTSIPTAYWEGPLSKYSPWALRPKTLQLLETFFELLLGNSFQCHVHSFKADFIFGNSQKSFEAESWEEGGCSISVIDFSGQKLLDGEHLVSWSTVTVEKPVVGPKFRPFLLVPCPNLVAQP